MSRKEDRGRLGEGGVHLKGANSMVVSGYGSRKALFGTGSRDGRY